MNLPADADVRRERQAARLRRHGQEHVFARWDSLSDDQKARLIDQVERLDFERIEALHRDLVRKEQPAVVLPTDVWEPARPIREKREEARAAGLAVLTDTARPRYGLLVVAGGSGSGLKFDRPKGLFPATPLSGTPLLTAIVQKSKAAAAAYGHAKMFPLVVMVSDETAAETEAFFAANEFFGEPDRVRFSRQTVLPLLDRRPGREGRVVMKSSWEVAVGGAGHGDAFDHALTNDAATAAWLADLGVRYLHFLNVDNLLNPVGDPYFLGEHVLSENPATPGRAHISVALIPKTASPRIGNIIEHTEGGRVFQESVDYGLLPEVDRRCALGHVSVQIVSLPGLAQSEPIPFMGSQKEINTGEGWVPVWKFERSSNNKKRYGALVYREADEIFAPIKKRDEDASIETPAAAARLQSNHWKTLIAAAGERLGRPWTLPGSTVVELPWAADHMAPETLVETLERIGFPRALAPRRGYLVPPGFTSFEELPLGKQRQETPPERAGRKARRWEDQSPDEHRRRALIAEFNNVFETDPDIIVRAPGRNTLIGDHMDYPPLPQDGTASSHTIAWASRAHVLVAARRRPDRALKLRSANLRQTFSVSLDDLEGLAEEAAHGNLPDVYGQELYPWALNVLALLYSAHHGRDGVRTGFPVEGAEFVIEGNVPMGGGQSSSAAFLVAMTLACNDLFQWGVPRTDLLTLADLARSGEHEDYSPFIRPGRCGYMDQIAILAAVEGKAVLIDHGDYRRVETIDLSFLKDAGYTNAVVLSGLSRSLGETDYTARVEELTRLPRVMNRLLTRRVPGFVARQHVHQFTVDEWTLIAPDLETEDPTLARRARYVFEEKERTRRLVDALKKKDTASVAALVNQSGDGMAMTGPYQISGLNKGPCSPEPFPALDALRELVLRRAGPGAAARMIGGGGAGPLCLLLKTDAFRGPDFARGVAEDWRARTGLTAKVEVDPPSAGADVLWRRPAGRVLQEEGNRRLEEYLDLFDEPVYRLVDGDNVAEILGFRGTVRAFTCRVDGACKQIFYNPEQNPVENGAAPYLGPWINRVKDGRARFRGQRINLMRVKGVRDDGHGHALHGLMTVGWRVDLEKSGIDADGVRLVSTIETADYTDHPDIQRMFGPSKTVLTHRLSAATLRIEADITHLKIPDGRPDHRIPVLAAVHPWFLLDAKKHAYAELTLPTRRHRVLWKRAWPRMQMIPVPFVPALPVPPFSRLHFYGGRPLGRALYDHTFTNLEPNGKECPTATLKDWFRNLMIEVGVVRGFNEFTIYRAGGDTNFVCLEPQVGAINALGFGAPLDAATPTLGPGESFSAAMFIRVSSLTDQEAASPFTAQHAVPLAPSPSRNLPILIRNGLEAGPLADPHMTTTHKDAVRVFFAGRWHIYGTGHEMRDRNNPPPGHRPHRRSILFHLAADALTGPYVEQHPPVLLGDFPKGIYEAPTLVAEGDVLHLFAQTTYYRLGGSIERFTSKDGHAFQWAGTALTSEPGGPQAGIYDVDAAEWDSQKALVYSAFSREGGRDDRPDPCVYLALGRNGWAGSFVRGRTPILTDKDVPWHNSHDPANPFYEWGLEGAQLMRLPNGRFLLLCVGFEKRPRRAYMAAQRLFFALYDERMKLLEVSNPILPLTDGWDEFGHGSMMVDPEDPGRLRLLFQARPANRDQRFRDSDTWRLFEALFDIRHLR